VGGSVGISTRVQRGRLRLGSSISGIDKRVFHTPKRPDRLWGSSSLITNRYRRKTVEHKADHSPPLSADVKIQSGYIPLTHIFMESAGITFRTVMRRHQTLWSQK